MPHEYLIKHEKINTPSEKCPKNGRMAFIASNTQQEAELKRTPQKEGKEKEDLKIHIAAIFFCPQKIKQFSFGIGIKAPVFIVTTLLRI